MTREARSQRRETPTNAEASLSSRTLHRLFLGSLRIIPMVMAGLFLLNTVLSYFDIDLPVISYIASAGFIPWLFIMAASYKLHFCEYHRMFLWYILANNMLCWTDMEFGLPISNWNFFVLHIIIAGFFLFLVLYFHQKCRRKS